MSVQLIQASLTQTYNVSHEMPILGLLDGAEVMFVPDTAEFGVRRHAYERVSVEVSGPLLHDNELRATRWFTSFGVGYGLDQLPGWAADILEDLR